MLHLRYLGASRYNCAYCTIHGTYTCTETTKTSRKNRNKWCLCFVAEEATPTRGPQLPKCSPDSTQHPLKLPLPLSTRHGQPSYDAGPGHMIALLWPIRETHSYDGFFTLTLPGLLPSHWLSALLHRIGFRSSIEHVHLLSSASVPFLLLLPGVSLHKKYHVTDTSRDKCRGQETTNHFENASSCFEIYNILQ